MIIKQSFIVGLLLWSFWGSDITRAQIITRPFSELIHLLALARLVNIIT